jgi:hypothetical protein
MTRLYTVEFSYGTDGVNRTTCWREPLRSEVHDPVARLPEAERRVKYAEVGEPFGRTASRRGSEKTISTSARRETPACPGGGVRDTIRGAEASRTRGGRRLSFPFGPRSVPDPYASASLVAFVALIVYGPVLRTGNRYVPSLPVVTTWSPPPESRIWTMAPASGVRVA